MKLIVNNIFTKVENASEKEIKALKKALSFLVPNHQFMPRYRMGYWDGRKTFFNLRYKAFLSGLLPFVLKLSKKHGFKVKIIDKRKVITIKKKNVRAALKLLRDYQQRELKSVLSKQIKLLPWMRGVVSQPTRSGKTFFAGGLIRACNCPSLIIVDGKDLLYQTQRDLTKQLQRSIGIIGDGKFELQKVTVATVQTLASRINTKIVQDFLNTIQLVIVDECQHQQEGIYKKVVEKCPAYFRFGFSATPLMRGDLGDIQLIGDTSEIISKLERKELEDQGWLSHAKIFVIGIDDPKLSKQLSYQKVYKRGIVQNEERIQRIVNEVKRALKRKRHTLVLIRYKSHGRELLRRLRFEKCNVVFLQGSSSSERRQKIIKKVSRSGKPIVIVATSILDQGVTMPDVRTVIIGGGGVSRIKSIQRVGRGLNIKTTGENMLEVIDFIDRTHPILERHSGERIVTYETEGFEVLQQE